MTEKENELTQEETNAALASGPGTVTIGERTILVDKITSATVFSVYEWGSKRARKLYNPFREVTEALNGLPIDASDRTRLLQQAGTVKVSGDLPGDLITECVRSVEGVAFQLFLFSRTHHPELTCEECGRLVTEENRIDVYVQIDEATGANIVNKALLQAGFTVPASQDASAGKSPTAAAHSEQASTAT